ncbi:MAG: alkaline phosphatase D family protein [bacterium]
MRLALGLVLALIVAATPAFSQVALLFPYGVAAGDVTSTSAVLWTRTDRRLPIAVEVSPDRGFGAVAFAAASSPSPDRGGTVKLTASRLNPGTRYFYRFKIGRGAYSDVGTFVTAPAPGTGADLRLAFSGDMDGTHVAGVPVFSLGVLDAVAAERPDVFIVLGDTIYSDSAHGPRTARTLDEYRAKYREVQTTASLRALLRATSVIATWDDHEVENDFDRESVDRNKFEAGRQAFQEAWPIVEQQDGRLYRSFQWGRDVEMFILDLRSYRSRQASKTRVCDNPPGSVAPDLAPTLPTQFRAAFAPLIRQMGLPAPAACLAALNDPSRTLLGSEQKRWLQQRLRGSGATWKFVVSQVPVQEFFANPYDRWEGYAAERAEVLNFVRAARIVNVVWLSADTHAVLINDIRMATYSPPFEASGMKEVVAGPIATTTFGMAIAALTGPSVVPAFAAFLQAPLPQGLGLSCAVLDRFTYATVDVSSAARTVTITPKDAAGRPVCRAPLVLSAAR